MLGLELDNACLIVILGLSNSYSMLVQKWKKVWTLIELNEVLVASMFELLSVFS